MVETVLAVALAMSVFANVVLIACVPWLFRRFFTTEAQLDAQQKQIDVLDEALAHLMELVDVPGSNGKVDQIPVPTTARDRALAHQRWVAKGNQGD